MSSVRYLADVHVSKRLARALRVREPGIDIITMGQPGAPAPDATDPELLQFAESNARLLLTMDRKTMLGHVNDHHAAGGHTWGIFLLKGTARWRDLVDGLIEVWSASDAEEWRDRFEYFPW